MVKKFLALAVAATVTVSYSPPIVSAENAKAEELREIINSKHYYIEYEVNKKEDKRALAVNGDLRKSFDCEGRRSSTLLSFIPIVSLFAKGSLKLMPEVYYDSNNYYQFTGKNTALRASPEEMNDPYINPHQEWNTIPLRVNLPEEFGMFTGDKDIKFVESGEKIIDAKKDKKFTFDKYVKNIRNVNGANIAKKVYLVYYDDKNEIESISTLSVYSNEDAGQIFAANEDKKLEEQAYEIQKIKINKFTGELPDKIMDFPEGCKVYGPGLGDMNELLEMPPLLEEHKAEVKRKK